MMIMSGLNMINVIHSGPTADGSGNSKAIAGTILETGVFNFRVSASKSNVYTEFKPYTLNVKPLVSIRNNKIFPSETIDLPSGSQFDFLN